MRDNQKPSIGGGTVIHRPDLTNIYGDCTIGKDCTIGAFVEIGPGVKIGDRCRIQAHAFIPEGVEIGDDVFIGPMVTFTNVRRPRACERRKPEKTVVEDRVIIGAGAVIVCGLTIYHDAFIAAGATVTGNVLPKFEVKGVW